MKSGSTDLLETETLNIVQNKGNSGCTDLLETETLNMVQDIMALKL